MDTQQTAQDREKVHGEVKHAEKDLADAKEKEARVEKEAADKAHQEAEEAKKDTAREAGK